ncbi:hypothetical protein [Fontibacillus phaseoli]|nr:hypothetical protein [Fontibacillus phaseoli]
MEVLEVGCGTGSITNVIAKAAGRQARGWAAEQAEFQKMYLLSVERIKY